MGNYIQDAGYFLKNPQGPRNRVYGEDGETLYERVPATVNNPQRIKRYVRVVRDNGNVISAVLTNCASNLDLKSPVAQYNLDKWRRNGWFPLGRCCVALALTGDLDKRALCKENQAAVKGKGKDGPCQRTECSDDEPCRHNQKEIEVRLARNAASMDKLEAKWKSSQDKLIDEQRAGNAQMAEAMSGISEVLGELRKGKEKE